MGLRDGALFWLRPVHAQSLRVGISKSQQPSEVVLEVAAWYPFTALVVHSTSWRVDRGGVVLTFCAVVPDTNGRESRPVRRADLARGGTTEAAANILEAQVIEHGLRHLSWLVTDDEVVGRALGPAWAVVLKDYVPEPFRPL